MSTAIVSLTAAVICFASQCHPVLVGKDTPIGTFPLTRRTVTAAGYGGDVLQFMETEREVFAVHRVWLLKPRQRRAERLASPDAADRRRVTGGCINVAPDVYDAMSTVDKLIIKN